MVTMPFDRRRALRYGLGSLWIFDALLKLQPAMFHAFLISNVLAPAATDSQPAWLFNLMMAGAKLWVHLGTWSSVLNFSVELLLGVLILLGPTRPAGRAGLWLSIFWGAVLWVFAEGLGGLVSGSPTIIQGSPGSAPFYMLAAGLLLAPRASWAEERIRRAARWGLGGFWLVAFFWQVLPSSGFWSGQGLAAQFGDVTMNGQEPRWLQMAINAMVMSSQAHPVPENALYSAILLLLAGLSIWAPRARLTWLLEFGWLLFLWAIPQAFGTLLTGTGTDPGMMWPFALLAVTLLGGSRRAAAKHSRDPAVTAKNAP